jgi:PPP family 3-phenylpropionic acid transporter
MRTMCNPWPASLSIMPIDSATSESAGMRPVSQLEFGFAPRLAALYGAFFIVAGISQPFLPVWLTAKGLDPGTIGVVLAAPMLLRILVIPLATRESDRRDALRAAIVIASGLSVVGYFLLGLAEGVAEILLAYALGSLAFSTVMPLAETYAFKGLSARGRAYGPVRLWGSATFILGTFAAGFALDIIPARHIIWMVVAASVMNALAAFALLPLSTAHAASATQTPRRSLLRDPAFIAVLAAASLIQASHAVYYGFSAVEWRSAGLDGATVAGLWALGVIAEIVLFALQGRLPPLFQPTVLLMIGALGGTLRWGAMALDPPALALPWLQLLHAASFGATHLGALGFVARHAPEGQSATAQGYLAIALGVAMAGAMGLSGLLYAAFGTLAYAAMALAAIAGGACAVVAHRARRVAAV